MEIIKIDKASTFCGGCNNTVHLYRFIQIDEAQDLTEAWEKRHDNENDVVFKRIRFMGFCICGNIYLGK